MKKLVAPLFLISLFLTGCVTENNATITPATPPPATQTQTGQTQAKSSSTQTTQSTKTAQIQTEQTQATQSTQTQTMQIPAPSQPKTGDTIAIMETDFGTIKIKMFTKDVPELSKNFIQLAKTGKYTNVPFHRVVKDFMIQSGDFTNKDGTGGYSYKGPGTHLANEIKPNIKHLYGTLSMAKTSAPVSIGSQFFIVTNQEGTPFLDGGYSPIGRVYEGMDVAEKIADLQVPGTEQPSKLVNIKKVTITTYAAPKTTK